MRLALAFIKWIFKKSFEGVIEWNEDFRRLLRNEAPLGIFLWFIISLISTIGVLLLCVGIQFITGLNIPMLTLFVYMGLCVVYLLYTAFSLMYNAFKAERAELFETIKNGR